MARWLSEDYEKLIEIVAFLREQGGSESAPGNGAYLFYEDIKKRFDLTLSSLDSLVVVLKRLGLPVATDVDIKSQRKIIRLVDQFKPLKISLGHEHALLLVTKILDDANDGHRHFLLNAFNGNRIFEYWTQVLRNHRSQELEHQLSSRSIYESSTQNKTQDDLELGVQTEFDTNPSSLSSDQVTDHKSDSERNNIQVFDPSSNLKDFLVAMVSQEQLVELRVHETQSEWNPVGGSRELTLYPHRVVFLCNQLNLVGEDLKDKTLVNVSLKDIERACQLNEDREESRYRPKFTGIDIEDFICGLRQIHELETRLILKVKPQGPIDWEAPDQYFRKPCLVRNSRGEFIWSAYVEQSEELYRWLACLPGEIEILDPLEIKADFEEFRTKMGFGKAA